MNLKQLEYFVAIADCGTISAAAKKLGIAQPPLSMQLKSLEDELGTTLVERSNKGLRLTSAGSFLYSRAETMLSMKNQTLKDMRDLVTGQQTSVRLGMISTCSVTFLNEQVRDYCSSHPQVAFQVKEGNTYQLLDSLRTGEIGLAVVRTPYNAEDMEGHLLGEEPMALVGQAGSELCSGQDTPLPLTALKNQPLIIYRRMERVIRDAFEDEGIVPDIRFFNDDARTALMWAALGVGYALVPQSIVSAFRQDRLAARPIASEALTTKTYIIRRRQALLTAAESEFFDRFAR